MRDGGFETTGEVRDSERWLFFFCLFAYYLMIVCRCAFVRQCELLRGLGGRYLCCVCFH